MKHTSLAFVVSFLVGCTASVVQLKPADPIIGPACQVEVFSSQQRAEEKGRIQEYCIVTGEIGVGSFDKSVGHAINTYKNDVCRCGVTKAYIKETASATSLVLVGFEYESQSH